MRVLIAHNAYQHHGGEDSVVESEIEMLRAKGHEVETYFRHNTELAALGRLAAAKNAMWSVRTVSDVNNIVTRFNPDVIHVHNTWAVISPSIYSAARAHGVPVVQTLHNFRLMCPQAMLLRDGAACEDCVGRYPWRGVMHRCYRGSGLQSAILASALSIHRIMSTYQREVSRFIALNEFCRQIFIKAGLGSSKISVKENFIDVPKAKLSERRGGVFVGRLAPEKGIKVLVDAVRLLRTAEVVVLGNGPELNVVRGVAGIRCEGFVPRQGIFDYLRKASYLVMPSIWYETFGLVIIEAFACGTPVIASRLGAMAELVREGETGLLFEPGSADDLAKKIQWAEQNPDAMQEMGMRARRLYEENYTSEQNYKKLVAIYERAIDECGEPYAI